MEALSNTNKRLNAAWANHDKDREARMKKIDDKENELMERLEKLNLKKHATAQANGNTDATDDDIMEINAGGKIIAAKRGTLTQLKERGWRLCSVVGGRKSCSRIAMGGSSWMLTPSVSKLLLII